MYTRWGLQSLGLCPAPMLFEQGRIFILGHLLWHGASVSVVSSKGSSHLVTSYDNHGILTTYSNQDSHLIWYIETGFLISGRRGFPLVLVSRKVSHFTCGGRWSLPRYIISRFSLPQIKNNHSINILRRICEREKAHREVDMLRRIREIQAHKSLYI